MIKIEEVAEATYRLEAILPRALYTFSVYLIRGTEGVLIEPGPAAMFPFIQEGMKQLGIASLSCIIPTHIHLDHGGGAGKLAELFPQARVVLHPRGARHIADPSRLIEGTRMAYGDDFELTYGPILPVPESQIKVPADGEIINKMHSEEIRRVISEKTANTLKSFFVGAVEHGTGVNARIEGITIGGKTGTAQKVLSNGKLTKKVPIAAWSFSKKSQEKIKKAGGKCMTIADLLKNNPEGKDVRILG